MLTCLINTIETNLSGECRSLLRGLYFFFWGFSKIWANLNFFFKLTFLLIVLQCFLLVQVSGAQSDTCLLESSPPPSSFQKGSCKWLGFKEKFVSRIKKKENTLFKDVICTPLHQKRQTMKKLSYTCHISTPLEGRSIQDASKWGYWSSLEGLVLAYKAPDMP